MKQLGPRIVVLLVLLLGVLHAPRPALAGGVVGGGFAESCTEQALLSALAGGGTVTFNCGTAPVTIVLSGRAQIGGDVTIDGDGLVTLSGGGTTGILRVPAGASLELRELSLADGNDALGQGGALDNAGALRLSRVTVRDSRAENGGGIANRGSLEVTESTLAGNHATTNGGGIFNDGGTIWIERTLLYNNTADFYGGGAYSRAGVVALTNSTLSENVADLRGGGLYHIGPAQVTWTTFVRNRASYDSGGSIYSVGALAWGSSVFAGGLPRNCAGIGEFSSQGHSVSSDGSCVDSVAGDLGNRDPRLGVLQDNGGPTFSHALLGGSPARDLGDPASCPETDQRGTGRPIDGNGDGISACDAGAFEAPPNAGPSAPGAPILAADSASPNRGIFTLLWYPADDPQGDPLTYTLLHKAADQTTYEIVAEGISANAWSFTEGRPEAEGVWTYIVRASDGAASSADSPPSLPVTVSLDALGTTIVIPGRRPPPPYD